MGTTTNGAIDLELISPVFEKYKDQKGALIPILQNTQEIFGYLPKEALQHIASKLGIAYGKVYGVATFYAQFYLEPRGKHTLKLCDGTACHVKGTPMLVTAVEDEFNIKPGQTTEDGELTLEVVYCVGSCGLAPVALMDDKVMGRARPDKLPREVKKQMKEFSKEDQVDK
jgi:NADH-quinone oxidoreductase subunit E